MVIGTDLVSDTATTVAVIALLWGVSRRAARHVKWTSATARLFAYRKQANRAD